jgi:hypothetical protein
MPTAWAPCPENKNAVFNVVVLSMDDARDRNYLIFPEKKQA